MPSRITKPIKYNLNDRGRVLTGKDRSNVDVQAMINKINSPYIQEQVDSGTLNGFCGHQIRQRHGMIPPESAEVDGKIILLEPSHRTVYLKADDDGTVTHKQEFYENDAGEHVLRQYKAKIGGFSTAVNYFVDGPILRPNVFGGFDYVFAPNFTENASIGLFDSAMGEEALSMFYNMLDMQIVELYDSMSESNQNHDYLMAMSKRARAAELELARFKAQTDRRVQKAKQLQTDQYDSALYSHTLNFDEQLQQAQSFFDIPINHGKEQPIKTEHEQKADEMLGKLSAFFGAR